MLTIDFIQERVEESNQCCHGCGYPFDIGDGAYTYEPDPLYLFCSKQCVRNECECQE